MYHVSKKNPDHSLTFWHNFTITALMSVVLDVENLRLIYNEIKTLYESYVRNRVPAEAISIATLMCRP